jgi:hypothetical protein
LDLPVKSPPRRAADGKAERGRLFEKDLSAPAALLIPSSAAILSLFSTWVFGGGAGGRPGNIGGLTQESTVEMRAAGVRETKKSQTTRTKFWSWYASAPLRKRLKRTVRMRTTPATMTGGETRSRSRA